MVSLTLRAEIGELSGVDVLVGSHITDTSDAMISEDLLGKVELGSMCKRNDHLARRMYELEQRRSKPSIFQSDLACTG